MGAFQGTFSSVYFFGDIFEILHLVVHSVVYTSLIKDS